MSSANLHEFNDEDFETEVLRSSQEVLVFFSATWAGPCRLMEPIVTKIADDYLGKVKVGKLDIDESPNIPRRFGVRSVPALIVFKGGQKGGAHGGVMSREQILQLLGIA